MSIDPLGGYVFAATGNLGNARHESLFYGNNILEMTPSLAVLGAASPPLSCTDCDLDLGSTSVLFTAPRCAPRLAVLDENHTVFVYRRAPFTTRALQALPNDNYVGDLAYGARSGELVSANLDGVRAYESGPACVMGQSWAVGGSSGSGGQLGQAVSPPAIANGVAYYGNGSGALLTALDVTTGATLLQYPLTGSTFAQPTVVNGTVFVATWDGWLVALRNAPAK